MSITFVHEFFKFCPRLCADYGGYNAYNQHRGGQMAPRPAPNADGWSSGENHLSQQQLYQYQQQQQQQAGMGGMMYQHPPPPMHAQMNQSAGWNPGASEFVPKSNLSAAAQEFVPRHMPRNTSQWAYQQQQQLYQQQQQHQQQQAIFLCTSIRSRSACGAVPQEFARAY